MFGKEKNIHPDRKCYDKNQNKTKVFHVAFDLTVVNLSIIYSFGKIFQFLY